VRVKVCGITNSADLEATIDAGADALGFVVDVPESPRNVPLDSARDLIDAIPPFVQSVAVSVFRSVNQVEMLCSSLIPDVVQLAGTLPHDAFFTRLRGIRLIRSIAVDERATSSAALRCAERFDAVLADSYVPGVHGGTGQRHNWAMSDAIRELIAPKPLILAGGLTAINVRAAIETVHPFAVDVSSGVEARPGIKDRAKVCAFIEAVAEANDGL
jgi:phosphoribosylanthranilate isomerase